MKTGVKKLARALVAAGITIFTAAGVHRIPGSDRSVATMLLVLEVLAVSTRGDRVLAIVTSLSAALSFSWYFIDQVGSLAITTVEGGITFCMMIVTALTGSHLAIRAQERAAEAIRRREEMERLHQLGTALQVTGSTPETAQQIVDNLVRLFDLTAAELKVEGQPAPFVAGGKPDGDAIDIEPSVIGRMEARYSLTLYGPAPSNEVRIALENLVDLVLDRARTASQRARLEATERGEEFRRTVLNSLAHNFKTPLTSIKAAASILRGRREVPADDAKELATVIDEEADRLDLMIRESLDLARIEAHQATPRLEVCSLAAIVETVADRLSRFLGGRRLTVDIAEDLPPIFGDRFLLEQMVVQVLDNAWKYSRPGAWIRVTAGVAHGGVYLDILNQGLPIPAEDQDRIFTRFYRGGKTSSNVEGTGMGLPIARSIAEAHAGRLTMENHPEGPGFRFMLPVGLPGQLEQDNPKQDNPKQDKNDTKPQHSGS